MKANNDEILHSSMHAARSAGVGGRQVSAPRVVPARCRQRASRPSVQLALSLTFGRHKGNVMFCMGPSVPGRCSLLYARMLIVYALYGNRVQ